MGKNLENFELSKEAGEMTIGEGNELKQFKPKHIYELPPNCRPCDHQAAGHFFGSGKRGLLQTEDGCVIKPEQTRAKGDEEHMFFKRLFLSDNLNQDEIQLRNFLPVYYGQFEHKDGTIIFFELNFSDDFFFYYFLVF